MQLIKWLLRPNVEVMLVRIAVCDDVDVYIAAICEAIERWREDRQAPSMLLQCYRSSEELLNALESQQQFDIIFLDIQIPNEISGMDLAKRIRTYDELTQIVFATNHPQYVYEGYHVNALRYLCKPIYPDQVFECLDITYRQLQITHNADITVSSINGKVNLNYKSILYIESKGHNLIFTLTHTQEPLIVKMALGQMYGSLPYEMFVPCHRSFIVNILYVRRIYRDALTMANDQKISIGKKHRDSLGAAFDHYYQGKRI